MQKPLDLSQSMQHMAIDIAIIGATGLVGQEMLKVIQERKLPFSQLLPVASAGSVGRTVKLAGHSYTLLSLQDALAQQPAFALFATGTDVSRIWAPRFAAVGTTVIDNSAAWRMHPQHKLIVPEVNGHLLTEADRLIANPNCSTIQLVMALAPLHKLYGLRRLVVATYQAVTGGGQQAVKQLMAERMGSPHAPQCYPYPVDLNVLPQIGDFTAEGHTQEEVKLMEETRKILASPAIGVAATAVRVPVLGGHALAVNATFDQDFAIADVCKQLQQVPGLVVIDPTADPPYPMPIQARSRDEVLVGRIRRDPSHPRTLSLFVVADNLRKGAATNAVQIMEVALGLKR